MTPARRPSFATPGVLCLLGLAACSQHGLSDAQRYQQAVVAEPEEAARWCRGIGQASMAGECGTFAARGLAEQGRIDAALAVCAAITAALWADECVFVVVDTAELVGAEAKAACDGAGRYRDFCFGHAVNRSLAALDPALLPLEVGQEDALGAALRAQVDTLGHALPRPHQQTAWFTAMARWMAQRWTDRPFDRADCGVATEDLCRRAYTETMQARMESVDRDTICRSDLTIEDVTAGGGTPWVLGSETITEPAWAALCMGVGVVRDAGQVRRGRGPKAPQELDRRGGAPGPETRPN